MGIFLGAYMQVIFYNYQDKKNSVNKNLTEVDRRDIIFLNSQNVINPMLYISGLVSNANYVYIQSLHRYYFIDDFFIDHNDSYIYNLSLDVLYTYKDKILNSYAKIINNDNMISASIDYTSAKQKQILEYQLNNPFDTHTDILVTSIHGN